MAIVKVKKDGIWTEAISVISDADTLDGKHADAFALATELNELQNLVGEKSVADQVFTLEQKVSQVLNNYYTKNDIENKNFASETYVDEAIASIPTPDVSGQINKHNTSDTAHADIREAIAANTSAIELLTNGASAEEVDSVNDLIQYVKDHGGEVTGMKADIKANADAIAAIKDGAEIDSFADVESTLNDFATNFEAVITGGEMLETEHKDSIIPAINEIHAEVDTKANVEHTHEISEISDLQDNLDRKLEYVKNIVYEDILFPKSDGYSISEIPITYGDGKFVAVTSGTSITADSVDFTAAYSEDGINWIGITMPTMPTNRRWSSVTYGDGKFVAISTSGTTAAYSEDGINWIETTMPTDRTAWRSVTYGDGKFVAVAVNTATSSTTATAAYSEDGINWIETTMPTNRRWSSVTYGDGKFVAISTSGRTATAAYSEDGINWIETTMVTNRRGEWSSVTYGDDKFVAVGYAAAAYSEDGINWIGTTMPARVGWNSVTYGDGKFVAVAENKAAYSEDGINWIETIIATDEHWYFVAYGGGKFVTTSAGKNEIAYSEDGITWTNQKETGEYYYTIEQNNTDITEDIKEMLDIPSVETAEIGQTLIVKSVDENGKPTEWEAINQFPITVEDIDEICGQTIYYSSEVDL